MFTKHRKGTTHSSGLFISKAAIPIFDQCRSMHRMSLKPGRLLIYPGCANIGASPANLIVHGVVEGSSLV